jgi:DNA-binding XRE family transcriptional regulator
VQGPGGVRASSGPVLAFMCWIISTGLDAVQEQSCRAVPRKPDQADPALASTLRRLRQERELTLEQLAFEAKVTTTTVVRIEQEMTNPTWSTLRQISAGLGMTIADLAVAVEAERARSAAE